MSAVWSVYSHSSRDRPKVCPQLGFFLTLSDINMLIQVHRLCHRIISFFFLFFFKNDRFIVLFYSPLIREIILLYQFKCVSSGTFFCRLNASLLMLFFFQFTCVSSGDCHIHTDSSPSSLPSTVDRGLPLSQANTLRLTDSNETTLKTQTQTQTQGEEERKPQKVFPCF